MSGVLGEERLVVLAVAEFKRRHPRKASAWGKAGKDKKSRSWFWRYNRRTADRPGAWSSVCKFCGEEIAARARGRGADRAAFFAISDGHGTRCAVEWFTNLEPVTEGKTSPTGRGRAARMAAPAGSSPAGLTTTEET